MNYLRVIVTIITDSTSLIQYINSTFDNNCMTTRQCTLFLKQHHNGYIKSYSAEARHC